MFSAAIVVEDYKLHVVELNTMDVLQKKYKEKGYTFLNEKEWERFDYLRHISNFSKTEEEFKEYCSFAEKIGMPKPDKMSKIRPLHEKYDGDGKLLNKNFIIK